jgi:hypothetical protein
MKAPLMLSAWTRWPFERHELHHLAQHINVSPFSASSAIAMLGVVIVISFKD